MFRVDGYDPKGIPRVYGIGSTKNEAYMEAIEQQKSWQRKHYRRVDLVGISRWKFNLRNEDGSLNFPS